MSRRETQIAVSLQQWRGVDQRTSPTLVQDGFFVSARGVYFGLGDNAERVPGKQLSGKLEAAVLQVSQFGNNVLVQGLGKLWFTDVQGLLDFEISFKPDAPPAPDISDVANTSLKVTAPSSYPSHTSSFSLQRSLDDVSWTTIATNLATLQVFTDTGLTPSTLYYYRLISVGSDSTAGPSDSATTTSTPVTSNRITELSDTRITEAGDTRTTE